MRSPALLFAVLLVPTLSAAIDFDSGADVLAQAREGLRASPVPAAPAAAPAAACATEPEVVAFAVGSDVLPYGAQELSEGKLRLTLSSRLSPWEGNDVMAYVEVCDSTPHDPMENFEPCTTLAFDFGRQLQSDMKNLKIRRGQRTVASIARTPSGPELDWGTGGVASALAYRVENGRVVVALKK
jgi:hypothetical protein